MLSCYNQSSRYSVNIPSTISLIYTIFSSCYSENGGGIDIHNSDVVLRVEFSGFANCGCALRGGAIFVRDCKEIKLKNVCFDSCYSLTDSPSFQLASWGFNLLSTDINMSTESNPREGKYPSGAGGRNRFAYYYNNVTDLFMRERGSGNYFVNSPAGLVSSFCQFSGFVARNQFMIQNPSIIIFSHMNFLNYTQSTEGFVRISGVSSKTVFENSVFLIGSCPKMIFNEGTLSGSLDFNNCYFSITFTSSIFTACTLNSCYFPHHSTINIVVPNTYYCWCNIDPTQPKTLMRSGLFIQLIFWV